MRKFEESQILELKSVIITDIKKEPITFANTNGGEIYVVIDDDGKIIGLDNAKNQLERISNMSLAIYCKVVYERILLADLLDVYNSTDLKSMRKI